MRSSHDGRARWSRAPGGSQGASVKLTGDIPATTADITKVEISAGRVGFRRSAGYRARHSSRRTAKVRTARRRGVLLQARGADAAAIAP